jgi:predicted transcriptional regulator
MKYRSRTEIVSMILDSVNAGATKTRIMYKAYLSYTQLKEYLSYMEVNELIKYEEGTQLYRITEKGRKLMHLYEEIGDMVSQTSEDKLAKVLV